MLCQLTIRNIALIEALTVEFSEGFMALTGETGAGKSIVVDAMNLALGERAMRDLVRTGSEKAQVEALFDVTGYPRTLALLGEMGIDCEDGQVVISRELSLSGRNTCRVNGSLTPLSALRQLTMTMVDLHGQHEHQSLLDDTRHAGFLDAYGGEAAAQAIQVVRQAYDAYREARRQLRSLSGDARERAYRVDMLRFQIREIEQSNLREGEEEELVTRRDRLRNQEKILRALAGAHALLSGADDYPGAAGALMQAGHFLSPVAQYGERFADLQARLTEAAYIAEDAARELSSLLDDAAEEQEDNIDRIEQRLDDIRTLKKKYGYDVAAILAFRDQAEQELELLENSEERAAKLEQSIADLRGQLIQKSEALSSLRGELALSYAQKVSVHIHELGMAGARFEVQVLPPPPGEEEERLTERGYDQVRFLFSANAGEPVRELARIASGGEMSRVMLALKNVSADTDDVGCLIFDEIDTGISGRMAQVVGEKIARIAFGRQVICVTHLPQIACMADAQYRVLKREHNGRAQTVVMRLDEEGRVEEIARLVGGSESGVEHAKTLLKNAVQLKKQMIAKAGH